MAEQKQNEIALIDLHSDPIISTENDRKKRKSVTFVDKLMILEHWKRGIKRIQIATDFGLNISTVYKIIKDAPTTLQETTFPKLQEEIEEFSLLYPDSIFLSQRENLALLPTSTGTTTDSTRKKRIILSLSDKLNIIRLSKCGVSQSKIVEQYGTVESTIRKIIQAQDEIISSCEAARLSGRIAYVETRKHRRNGPYHRINELCVQWYTQKQSQIEPGARISRKMTKAKALEIAQGLSSTHPEFKKFKASDGWLDSFFKVYGISEKKRKRVDSAVLAQAKEMLTRVMDIAREAGILYEERAIGLTQLGAEFEELQQEQLDLANRHFTG